MQSHIVFWALRRLLFIKHNGVGLPWRGCKHPIIAVQTHRLVALQGPTFNALLKQQDIFDHVMVCRRSIRISTWKCLSIMLLNGNIPNRPWDWYFNGLFSKSFPRSIRCLKRFPSFIRHPQSIRQAGQRSHYTVDCSNERIVHALQKARIEDSTFFDLLLQLNSYYYQGTDSTQSAYLAVEIPDDFKVLGGHEV